MKLAWLHPDCLTRAWIPSDSHSLYVFDDAQLDADEWGIKRMAFVYETLLGIKAGIRRGPMVATLLAAAQEHGADAVVTVATPDPWLQARIRDLRQHLPVEVLPAPVFVELDERTDLKRFSRYWRRAERQLLS